MTSCHVFILVLASKLTVFSTINIVQTRDLAKCNKIKVL